MASVGYVHVHDIGAQHGVPSKAQLHSEGLGSTATDEAFIYRKGDAELKTFSDLIGDEQEVVVATDANANNTLIVKLPVSTVKNAITGAQGGMVSEFTDDGKNYIGGHVQFDHPKLAYALHALLPGDRKRTVVLSSDRSVAIVCERDKSQGIYFLDN